MKRITAILALVSLCQCDVLHFLENQQYEYPTTTTPPSVPNPYNFQYAAGRAPGHIDRVQAESGDGIGHVQGSFSYIDPKFKIRTVEYKVDENGFQPTLINYDDVLKQPSDSEAVRNAKERHRILYNRIAAANAHGAIANTPKDTLSVARAKEKHLELFQKIAAEHASIAAKQEAERLAFEATSVQNDVDGIHTIGFKR